MFNTLFIIAAIVEIPLVALFLKFYWPDRSIKSLTTKIICSLIFVLGGIFASQATGNDTSFATNMIWGLALGMVGDILLHSLTTNMLPFIIGVVAFLVGHIFYIVALQDAILAVGYSEGAFVWYEIAIVATILVLALIYGLKTNVFKRKGAMAYGLVVYGLVLATMLAKAVRCVVDTYASGAENALMVLLTVGVGALLFVMSDLSLGVILSDDKPAKRGMRIFNIETYYIAQMLLAGSMFYVFS